MLLASFLRIPGTRDVTILSKSLCHYAGPELLAEVSEALDP